MGQYRLLATSMMVGDNREIRAHRGDMVEVDDDRAKGLIEHGVLVEKGKESDADKKEFEATDSVKEQQEKDQKSISEQEDALAKLGGEKDNKTKDPNAQAMVPVGAPAGSQQVQNSKS
jgi:hypothetical protein